VWWETRNKANAGERMLTVEEVQQRTMEASLNFDHLQVAASNY
jgi:hypothetical protein